jgi:hypothetical protein
MRWSDKKARFPKWSGQKWGLSNEHGYRVKTLAVFVYGFPKSAKANLNAVELDVYKKLAQVFLSFSDQDIAKALNAGELMEVDTHGQEIQK